MHTRARGHVLPFDSHECRTLGVLVSLGVCVSHAHGHVPSGFMMHLFAHSGAVVMPRHVGWHEEDSVG